MKVRNIFCLSIGFSDGLLRIRKTISSAIHCEQIIDQQRDYNLLKDGPRPGVGNLFMFEGRINLAVIK
jgi:hypothetical protein